MPTVWPCRCRECDLFFTARHGSYSDNLNGELAKYLGINRTALYRAIAKLRKSGKVRIEVNTLALA